MSKILGKYLSTFSFQNLTLAAQINQIQRPIGLILIAVLLTKTGFSKYDIGVFETLLFIATFISYVGIGSVISSLAPMLNGANDADRKAHIRLTICLILALNILIVSVLYFFAPSSIQLICGNANLPFFNLFCIYLFLHFSSVILDVLYLINKQSKALILLSVANFAALFGSVLLSIVLHTFIEGILLGWIFYTFIKNILLIYFLIKNQVFDIFKIHKSLIIKYLAFALPMILYNVIGGIGLSMDSWLINWFTKGDKEIFGIYRYGAREIPLLNGLAIGLSNAMVIVIGSNLETGLRVLKEKSTRLMHLIYPIGIVLLLISPYLYEIVFSTHYRASAPIFNVYILLIITRAIFPQTILNALKDSKSILWIGITEMSFNVLFSFILYPYFGIMGIAYGTLIAFFLDKILALLVVKYKYNIDFQDYTNIKVLTIYTTILIFVYFFTLFI